MLTFHSDTFLICAIDHSTSWSFWLSFKTLNFTSFQLPSHASVMQWLDLVRQTLTRSFPLLFYLHLKKRSPYVIDHKVHNGLGHEVPDALVDDGHVGVHQIPDGLHLSLKLRIHGEVFCSTRALTLHLIIIIRGKTDVRRVLLAKDVNWNLANNCPQEFITPHSTISKMWGDNLKQMMWDIVQFWILCFSDFTALSGQLWKINKLHHHYCF